jgi:hypothetical protein
LPEVESAHNTIFSSAGNRSMAFYESDLAARRANSFSYSAADGNLASHSFRTLSAGPRHAVHDLAAGAKAAAGRRRAHGGFAGGAKGVIARPTVIHE